MNPFGRQKSRSWPKRWAGLRSVFIIMLTTFAAGALFQYSGKWTSLQRYYLPAYVETWALPYKPASEYLGVFLVKGRLARLATDADIELTTKQADGTWLAAIGSTPKAAGWKSWDIRPADTDRIKSGNQLHQLLARRIYHIGSAWAFVLIPTYWAFAAGICWMILALPRDLKVNLEYKYGRWLKGPQLIGPRQYHLKMRHPDGLGFLNLHRNLIECIFFPRSSSCVRIPRDAEAHHLLILGDTGKGKSSGMRQLLIQIEERGESAIVLDPAREYVRHFYDPSRGDVVLNPLDVRCPFWTPGAELDHEAEADVLAEAIFPIPDETPLDKRFFFTAARDVFIELMKHTPTPAQLYRWMCNEDEMVRLLRGTHVSSQIAEKAQNQRSGVFGTLTQSAKMFEFLPDAAGRSPWSARAWAEKRESWVFLTSMPMLRGRLRPLTTMWLELLLTRVMNDEEPNRQTHFVLDELATLPRIEQLVHALFEARKSHAAIVIGLQGKAQQDAKYGIIAQAMASMPATKVFLGATEPNAAKWISDSIGEVEIERYRESRNESHGSNNSQQQSGGLQCEITREPLVMASQIKGLPPLYGYFSHQNFVVPIRMPFIPPQKIHPGFIRRFPRGTTVPVPSAMPTTEVTHLPQGDTTEQTETRDVPQEQAQGYF